jgi:hypothetical protein
MYRAVNFALVLVLIALAVISADAADAKADKKKKTDKATPASYSKVASVDQDKKTFTLSGDDTTYSFTEKTPNKDRLTVGSMIKVTLKEGSKTEVEFIEPAPSSTTTPKKK